MGTTFHSPPCNLFGTCLRTKKNSKAKQGVDPPNYFNTLQHGHQTIYLVTAFARFAHEIAYNLEVIDTPQDYGAVGVRP